MIAARVGSPMLPLREMPKLDVSFVKMFESPDSASVALTVRLKCWRSLMDTSGRSASQ